MKKLISGPLLFIFFIPLFACAADWPPLSPADLALKTPKIDPDAEAEALLWDVRVSHDLHGNDLEKVESHYIRIKIFTDRGRDRLSTVDVAYGKKEIVSDISGRTIKPNGEIVELKKDAIFDRTIVKTGGVKVKAKSFAMPAVETGSIIEYRYKISDDDPSLSYTRLEFQRDIPVENVTYHIRPISIPGFNYGMRRVTLHLTATPFTPESQGFYVTTASNLPAFKEEPDMPGEPSVRSWMLLYYTEDTRQSPDKFWDGFGKRDYGAYKGEIKLNDEMRRTAAELVTGATTPEEKFKALFQYVRKNFKNTESEETSRQERAKVKENHNTTDTWKQKAGSGYEMALMFVALASAVDLEARVARTGHRRTGAFDKSFTETYFLRSFSVAMKIGDGWKFCDPSDPLLPFGMLDANEEGQAALIPDPKQPQFITTPVAPPDASKSERSATFKLDTEGTLEGDVHLEYTGHPAVTRRRGYAQQSPEERDESVRTAVKERFSDAEVGSIKIEGATDPLAKLVIAYHVKVPNYAARTGRRLFLKCAYFERDFAPRYTTTDRKYPVYLPYAWSDHDQITYELPGGYSLEKAEAPGGFKLGAEGEYKVKMTITHDQRTLTYERGFNFGVSHLMFPVETYKLLKQAFEAIQESDNHTLSVRQNTPAGS